MQHAGRRPLPRRPEMTATGPNDLQDASGAPEVGEHGDHPVARLQGTRGHQGAPSVAAMRSGFVHQLRSGHNLGRLRDEFGQFGRRISCRNFL